MSDFFCNFAGWKDFGGIISAEYRRKLNTAALTFGKGLAPWTPKYTKRQNGDKQSGVGSAGHRTLTRSADRRY